MPAEQTIIAVAALVAGLLVVGAMLAVRRRSVARGRARAVAAVSGQRAAVRPESNALGDSRDAESTLRVAWWLTITIVLLGVGISGSFSADQAPIFVLGGAAALGVVLFREVAGPERGSVVRFTELVVATGLIAGLLALTGFAASPFAMLFALVAVAAALAYGSRAGLAAAGLATAAFVGILLVDPQLVEYGPEDALRLSIGLGATWLLAFIAIAYAGHQRRVLDEAIAAARTDPLTGLFNRGQLHVTLDQEVSRTRRSDRGFCLLMIDLDGLKAINDSAGHARGDEVLRALGNVIVGSIRTVDSAYRLGGDEFVVLLPETDIVGAFVVAEKIRSGAEELGETISADDAATTVSIGLVSHPEDGLSADELMSAADRAMYQAKRQGKNQISGNPRPRPALLARRSVTEPRPRSAAEPASVANPSTDSPDEPRPTPTVAAARAPDEDRAVAVELGPIVVNESSPAPRPDEVDDADPQEVRRRIASASRSFDPDHQIRRAMDAFLSPVPSERERDRPTPDH